MSDICTDRAELLRQLRRVVVNLPDAEFDMRQYGKSGQAGCSTVCCAAGAAYFDPWFREHTTISTVFKFDTGNLYPNSLSTATALARIFRLPEYASDCLFGLDTDVGSVGGDLGKVTRADVIANIDRILARKQPIPY